MLSHSERGEGEREGRVPDRAIWMRRSPRGWCPRRRPLVHPPKSSADNRSAGCRRFIPTPPTRNWPPESRRIPAASTGTWIFIWRRLRCTGFAASWWTREAVPCPTRRWPSTTALGPNLQRTSGSDGTFEFGPVADGAWRLWAKLDRGGVKLWTAQSVEVKDLPWKQWNCGSRSPWRFTEESFLSGPKERRFLTICRT